MDTTQIIKKLVLLELALLFLYVGGSIYLESYLPEVLQSYFESDVNSEFTSLDWVTSIFSIVIFITYLISVVGLLLTKVWAKNIYIIMVVLSFLYLPFSGPTVEHAISAMIYDLTTFTEGIIVALLCFTQSSFNKSSKWDAASVAPS